MLLMVHTLNHYISSREYAISFMVMNSKIPGSDQQFAFVCVKCAHIYIMTMEARMQRLRMQSNQPHPFEGRHGKKTSRDTFTVPAKHFQVSNVVLTMFTRLSLHGATSLPQLMAQAESPWRTASLPNGTEHYSCSHLFLCHFIGPEIFKDLIVFKAFWISHQYLPGLDHQQYSPQKFEVPSSSGLLLRYKIYRQMELYMTFFLLSSRVFVVS